MKILIIEDEKELVNNMVHYLDQQQYSCDVACNFDEALDKTATFEYDCILLDITIPGGNGLSILKELKAKGRTEGVIVISAKDSIDDRIAGLNLGADDYLPKPFHLSEMGARVAAVIRRRKFSGNKLIVLPGITVDTEAKSVTVGIIQVDLTKREYDLLLYLCVNKNRVVSKNAIAEYLSGGEDIYFDNFDFIYTHIKNIKRKLFMAGCDLHIKTVYGMGYKLESDI